MESHPSHANIYQRLAIMVLVSFVVMYGLMYAMVDSMANVFMNINQVYMAGLMAAPMAVIELIVMRAMYRDPRMNRVVAAVSVAVLLLCWFAIRRQGAVGDHQFLRSMIPHHGGAILMCREAAIESEPIRTLCREIIQSQQREIETMKMLLAR